MPPHKALFAAVLKNLGHKVPSEDELDQALKASFAELKSEGGEADDIKYKVTLTPVEGTWAKETFSTGGD